MGFRRSALGLLIPIRMNQDPTHRCNLCDWVGYSEREQVAHVKEHLRADYDEIVEAVTPLSEKLMGEGGDPERQAYLERRYRQLLPQVGPKEALNPDRY